MNVEEDTEHSALRAVAWITTAQLIVKNCPGRDWARGPKRGTMALTTARQQGLDMGSWMMETRATTVVRSAPASMESAKSALRCWAGFADGVLGLQGHHLPPSE